jgi:hypothetical protein
MKKIIAAAVATAFVMPAMASEVSISGTLSEYLIDETSSSGNQERLGSESNIAVTASSEGNNGWGVKGVFTLTQAGGDWYGEGITVTHPSLGSVTMGNPAGAIDAVDDKSEVLELMDPTAGHKDSAVLWKLPTFVEGLAVNVSYSPEDTYDDQITGSITTGASYNNGNTGVGEDESGFSVQYTAGAFQVAYGQSNYATNVDASYMGAKYSANGVMIAIDNSEYDNAGSMEDAVSIGASYTMGDLTVKGLTSTYKDDGTKTQDRTAYGVHYDLGGGLTVIVETGSEDTATTAGEFTGMGVRYKF